MSVGHNFVVSVGVLHFTACCQLHFPKGTYFTVGAFLLVDEIKAVEMSVSTVTVKYTFSSVDSSELHHNQTLRGDVFGLICINAV